MRLGAIGLGGVERPPYQLHEANHEAGDHGLVKVERALARRLNYLDRHSAGTGEQFEPSSSKGQRSSVASSSSRSTRIGGA